MQTWPVLTAWLRGSFMQLSSCSGKACRLKLAAVLNWKSVVCLPRIHKPLVEFIIGVAFFVGASSLLEGKTPHPHYGKTRGLRIDPVWRNDIDPKPSGISGWLAASAARFWYGVSMICPSKKMLGHCPNKGVMANHFLGVRRRL